MAVNLNQNATLANLKQTVENMKVYIDSDKTVSIKGYLKENNTHKFYNTSMPTADTTPIFSFDVATEYFLDQTKTTFVQEFEWSDTVYTGSTNPNLEGKPVFVLAVKGDDTVSYSFVNLETLIDTYKTKDTTTLSLDITDNEISGNVNISAEEGNAVVVKEDGLYVPTTAETKVSDVEDNQIISKDDGIYVAPTDLDDYSTTDEVKELIKDELYTENTISAHYELSDSSNPNALEVVADGAATDGQIDLSSVADIGANIGDFVVFVDEVTTTDTKYAEKSSVYSKSETDEKIAEAVTGGTVSLDGYVKEEDLNTTLEGYTTNTKLTETLESYELADDITELSEDDIKALLELDEEEILQLTSLISDDTIETGKTHSSSKIYQDLQQVLTESKAYTLEEISKSNADIQGNFLTKNGFGNLRYYNDKFQYYDTTTSSWIDIITDHIHGIKDIDNLRFEFFEEDENASVGKYIRIIESELINDPPSGVYVKLQVEVEYADYFDLELYISYDAPLAESAPKVNCYTHGIPDYIHVYTTLQSDPDWQIWDVDVHIKVDKPFRKLKTRQLIYNGDYGKLHTSNSAYKIQDELSTEKYSEIIEATEK